MKIFLRFFLTTALLLIASCTSLNEQRVNLLTKAGFNATDITTEKQKEEFDALPVGKITTVNADGKTYFLYPDSEAKEVLIGREPQMNRYKKLLSRQWFSTLKMHNGIQKIKKEDSTWGNMKGWDKEGWDSF